MLETKLEPKPAPRPVEAKAIAKPGLKVDPKAEARQKVMVSSPSYEAMAESLDLEVRQHTH